MIGVNILLTRRACGCRQILMPVKARGAAV
jgi:hypothetical protein